jgi:hypothetical protein
MGGDGLSLDGTDRWSNIAPRSRHLSQSLHVVARRNRYMYTCVLTGLASDMASPALWPSVARDKLAEGT